MLVLGHTGITLGATALLTGVLGSRVFKTREKESLTTSSSSLRKSKTTGSFPNQKASWFTSLVNRIDLRFLLIGSFLPDIIDKPIGLYFFRETFHNGRIFCHTLLFLILVTVAGFYFYRRNGRTRELAFSFGIFTHLILDQMWYTPRTLLWPLLGFSFERIDISNWTANILHALLTDPAVYIPELAGAVILFWFAWLLLNTKRTFIFLKYGQI